MFKYFSLLIIVLISAETSFAHKITVFAWAEGYDVHVESKFSGGRKIINGGVTVVSSSGDIIHKGTTNNKGEYSFKVKKKESLKIYVDAGQGHKGYWNISKGEFEGTYMEEPHKKHEVKKTETNQIGTDIREIVDSVVSSRLKPIQKELALLRKSKEPGFQDIAGAIGYIFGLMGVFLYFKYGRQK